MDDKIKIIGTIENNKIKKSLEWSISKLNENPSNNTIIYAPNASGKTILSNILSGSIPHFHTKYVEYVDDDKKPHIILLNKAKKFSYKDSNSHIRIIESNNDLKELYKLLNNSISWYKGKADLMGFKFLESINQKLINESRTEFNSKIKNFDLPNETNFELDFNLEPYHKLSWEIDLNWEEKIKKITVKNSQLKGDGKYINNLLKLSKSNETIKNSIYSLILLAHNCEEQILELIQLEMGILMRESYDYIKINKLNKEVLNDISYELEKVKIINEETNLKLDNNKKIIFINKLSKKNVTREIFKKISEGQTNHMSFIFFSEITIKQEKKIIFDDPFDTLDNKNSYEVLRMIKKWEKEKTIIVLTHKSSSFYMMKEYLSKNWNIHYLKNKICFAIEDLDEFNEKLIHTWKNGNYGEGILLMFRYLKNDNKLNCIIYESINNKIFIFNFLKNYYLNKEKFNMNENQIDEHKCKIYDCLLKEYDKLLEIKKFLRNNYEKKELSSIKKKIKKAILKTEDKILQKYEKLYFVINDLSHKNNWGYNLLEILSFNEEINELYELCKEAINSKICDTPS